ncbi:MAG: peptidylprolyl isomerase, partial [Gemmatimonadales bacterium]
MLRTFRAQTKWVFWILTVSFVGWLAFSQVTDILGPSATTVLEIDGREIAAADFERLVRQTEEQYRQQTGAMPTTRDERRELENQVVEQLVESVLLQREYARLGIEARPEEIVAAARTSPPPELRDRPEFQTDGRFDPAKWERFLATADPQFQLALEARYREEIPRIKLAQYITADVYLSDAKLWRMYRDQHDSVRVALLALRPADVPDTGIAVTDAELRAYLSAHQEEYRRPAVAYLSYVALDRRPDRADSAAALALAREIMTAVSRGGADEFARRAREVSADSVTADRAGDLGWLARTDPRLAPPVQRALRALRPGEVSAPVLTPLGYELLRVDRASGDSVRARRIVIPIALTGDRLDAVESRA